MNVNDGTLRIKRILRQEEKPLVIEGALAIPYDDPELRVAFGRESRQICVAVTPARLIEVGDGQVRSARWSDIGGLAVSKIGRKWRYQWTHITQTMMYSPVQISKNLAVVLQDIQAGRIPLTVLPAETTTWTALDTQHDGYAFGRLATAMGTPAKTSVCDACGTTVGWAKPDGPECHTCHRTLKTI